MKRNHRQSPYIFLVVQEVNSYRIFSVRNLFLFRVVRIKKLRIVVCIAGRTADCRYLFPIYFFIFHFLLKGLNSEIKHLLSSVGILYRCF